MLIVALLFLQWNIYPKDQGYVTRIILGDNLYSTEDGNKVVVKTADSGTHWELIESTEVEFVSTYLLVPICIFYCILSLKYARIKPEKEDDKRHWTVSSADGEQNVRKLMMKICQYLPMTPQVFLEPYHDPSNRITIRGGISLDLRLMTRAPPARFRQKEPFHSCVVVVSNDQGLRVLNRVRLCGINIAVIQRRTLWWIVSDDCQTLKCQ